jgi:hypothetical protein
MVDDWSCLVFVMFLAKKIIYSAKFLNNLFLSCIEYNVTIMLRTITNIIRALYLVTTM